MTLSSTRIPRSASSSGSTRRLAMTVTSPFFTPNRFAVLPVDRCPVFVLVRSSRALNARERRRRRRQALRDDLRMLADELRREEEEKARAAVAAAAASPIKQATTTYRRYFYGQQRQELYSLSEMRVADRLVETYIPSTRRVAGRRMSIERPLRERVLRTNLLRSLTVIEYKTTFPMEDSDWNMTF